MPRRGSWGPQAPPWSPATGGHLCPSMLRPQGWNLVFAHQPGSAEQTAPTEAPPASGAGPQEGFGVAGGSHQPQVLVLWCVSAGSLAGWPCAR